MPRFDSKRNVWRITADATTPGGKRHRIVRSVVQPNDRAGRKIATAAEVTLRARTLEQLERWGGTDSSATFGTVATDWLDRNRHRWSPSTVRTTEYVLRNYLLPALGDILIERVTPARIEDLYARWEAQFSPSTTRRYHGMVRAIFADAERLDILKGPNPMRRVRPAGGRALERINIPAPADVRVAIDNAASPAGATFFELAVATGARRGTLVALRWRDVDLDAGRIDFAHAMAVGPDNVQVLKGTKADRPYSISLSGRPLAVLAEHRARAARSALALGLGRLDDLYVFSRDGGRSAWSVHYPSHAWQIACYKAGVKNCRLHDLRHFAATQMLAAGFTVRVVADRLGCTESNVIRTYSHRVPSNEDARAADFMANLLG
jgi:integrase